MRKTIKKTIDKGLDTGKEVLSYPFEYPKKLTKLFIPEKQHVTPLKRSMSGYETETFILNSDGSIDHSDSILKKAEKKKLDVKPECAKSMIEVICLPHKKLSSTSTNLINNLISLTELTEKNGKFLYPFATYPGTNKPVFRKKPWYTIKQKILGHDRFVNAGLCCGFHQHYALPRGMFNPKTKFLEYKIQSKVKKTLLDSYNLLVAMDPIMTCLLQSSPYANNKYIGKDSRMLLYRGGKKLKYMKGLYATHQLFGALPPYKQTLHDLISSLDMRDRKWKKLLSKAGYNTTEHTKENSRLDFCWNPIKVNPKGTLEYRGGDMNFLSMIFGVATMMTFALRKVQQDFLIVVPMDIDLKESFKVENNMMFIPPHTAVRNNLQKDSAYDGFKNKDLNIYINRFYKFIKENVEESYHPLLKPVKNIIDNEKTMSDKIIAKARRAGYKKKIPESYAKELALHYGSKFMKDLEHCKDTLKKVGE